MSDRPSPAPTPHLRITYVWRDELMCDEVLPPGQEVVLGPGKRATVTTADVGLPDGFVLLRRGLQGYMLTLGQDMSGRLLLDGKDTDVAEVLTGQGERADGSAGAFRALPIGPRDAGMLALDPAGEHVLTFQFVAPDPALPPPTWTDSELFLPALAFSLILHTVIVAMTFALHIPGNSLLFPGRTELMTSYLVERPVDPPPPEKGAEEAADKDGEKENVKSATEGKKGKAGGEGKKPRQRDPDPGELPPEIETGLLSKESREVLRQTTRNPAIDKRLKRSLARLKGLRNQGGLGSGTGTGIGFGPGRDGTGTTRGGRGGGPGGGGSVQGDFVSQGDVDVGETRRPRGTGGGGRGAKEVAVVATGSASGDFGGLSKAEIDRVVKSRSGLIRACYQRELNRARGLSGKLVVSFRISADGAVKSARVVSGKSSLRNAKVESCVIRQITRLKFPAKGGGVVNYPFIFSQG
ncbi:AgmX/PglI C-terminal domain-containing protein [Haliangium sp.]|uniref:AgmX/PglI C-terminal domain-containing protein n=1 Tax=Haliangium sp. TaxID=2663208 RepID=UPI003D12AD72